VTARTPFPPLELANRVGSLADADDPDAFYDAVGRATKDAILSLLPIGWTFEGKRILDFGCGPGRTLRHFVREAQTCEFWACDIHRASVEWVQNNLPPFRVFVNDEAPPMPLKSESFDLVYAVSVFTHLTETWSSWLLEMHRILAPGGLLVATFIGKGATHTVTEEPWDEKRIGMNVIRPGQTWELGGPMVLHSPWWIAAHWGRAFEIVDLQPDGFAAAPPEGQGSVLMRKRSVALTESDLKRPENDPRETLAAKHNVEQLARELVVLRDAHDHLSAAWRGERAEHEQARQRERELLASLARIERSRSWRLTQPLRTVAARFRR
jgi:SAM-dependent methyltransferase